MNRALLLGRIALALPELALLGLALALFRQLALPQTIPVAVPALAAAMIGGATLTASSRWLPRKRGTRLLRVVALLALGLYITKIGLGLGSMPLSGWSGLAAVMLNPSDPRAPSTNFAFILVLAAIWRGTLLRVPQAPVEVGERFKRGLPLLGALLVLTMIVPVPDPAGLRATALRAVVVYLVGGLLAHALFVAAGTGWGDRALSWRGLLPLIAALAIPFGLVLWLNSLLAPDLAALGRQAFETVAAAIEILLTPVAWLVGSIVEWARSVLGAPGDEPPPEPLPRLNLEEWESLERGSSGRVYPLWLLAVLPMLPYLLPLIALALLLFFHLGRAALAPASADERESVWSWEDVGRDLSAWWGGLRRGQSSTGDGLQAALARLQGNDPTTVIRRAYVHLLQHGARTGQARQTNQTPAEYARGLARVLDRHGDAVQQLTHGYERARYNPHAVTPDDAAAALAAWERIEEERSNVERRT